MWKKRLNFEHRFITLRKCPEGDPVGGDPGSKGGAGGGAGAPDPAGEIATLKAEIAALKAAKAPPKKEEEDPDLNEKARLAREAKDQVAGRDKKIESAIRFTMGAKDFAKQNEAILPKDIPEILAQAEKENFADAIEKDSAIKAGLVQSFFSVQANVDLLTAPQKTVLDEYLKLTKTGKADRAQSIYDMVFEPAFETLKRVKKAEALSKGYGGGNDAEAAYKNKMMTLSKKHYLGEK